MGRLGQFLKGKVSTLLNARIRRDMGDQPGFTSRLVSKDEFSRCSLPAAPTSDVSVSNERIMSKQHPTSDVQALVIKGCKFELGVVAVLTSVIRKMG